MKRLVIVNGPMAVGKTTVCRELKRLAQPCVFLDGDWCWDMEPFVVTEETKALVMDNITSVLRRFLACPAFETVIFCWVLHQQEIMDSLLARLELAQWDSVRQDTARPDSAGVQVRVFTLMADPESLRAHVERDTAAGLRTPDVLARSLERLPLYERMDTEKLWVKGRSPRELAEEIMRRLG